MYLDDFTGARRISLVGRQHYLQNVDLYIRRTGCHLLYFEGEGGIGKTFLLEAILTHVRRQVEAMPELCVVGGVLDFYHSDIQTPEGLIRSLLRTMEEHLFDETHEALAKLDDIRRIGNISAADNQLEIAQGVFFKELNELAHNRVVVLAFDTLEVLAYVYDPFREKLRVKLPVFGVTEWLLHSFLPALRGNLVLLMAGRPTDPRVGLKTRLHNLAQEINIHTFDLECLQEDEARAYLDAVAESQIDAEAAWRLRAFCENREDVIHFLTAGRPILLALVADLVAHGWMLPPIFNEALETLRCYPEDELKAQIEHALVVRIQESPTPIGETVRQLAWLRKGATPELLARVMDLLTPQGEWDIEKARRFLNEVMDLTLVKVRSGDEKRIFLHD